MLLSVVVYKHKLTGGQWLGAGVVFAGISVEAAVKRKGMYEQDFVVVDFNNKLHYYRRTC